MPGLARRREVDLRAPRLESEIRTGELGTFKKPEKGLPQCSNCGRIFEERSKYCPRCDKPTMGLLKEIPEEFKEQARRRGIRDAMNRLK